MSKLSITELPLKGAFIIFSSYRADHRGDFTKDFSVNLLKDNGLEFQIKETFYTQSKSGVLRGIHFQTKFEQAKIVRCIVGKIYDVIVDLRANSTTYKQWIGIELTGENRQSLLVPKGFGHGFFVIDDALVSYKCDEVFSAENDSGIIWNDVDLDIDWPIHLTNHEIILSKRDESLQTLREFEHRSFNQKI